MYQRERLFSKLSLVAHNSFVKATKICQTFRHEYIDLEHWLKAVLEEPKSDIYLLLKHFEIDPNLVNQQIDKALFTMTNKTSAITDFSVRLENALERGLLLNQLIGEDQHIRTIHIFMSFFEDSVTQRWLYRLSNEFKNIPFPKGFDDINEILKASAEHELSLEKDKNVDKKSMADSQSCLDKWCIDLTALAKNNEVDPVIGRDEEIYQIIDILMRRRQNNPILVGDAGVGKTAIAEALAEKIAKGEVPAMFKDARLLSLDLGRLQSGASLKGEFEKRLKDLVDAVLASDVMIILFCDEAHTLVGAGGQAGTNDAVNLLKPMLARGSLRMIAATTWSEYKQFIEPDSALTRRFQTVLIGEPDEEKAIDMLRAISIKFAKHHQVKVLDSAVIAAVKLSRRHLPLRQLPDKAISLMDTACARVAMSKNLKPFAIEELEAKLTAKHLEFTYLENEDFLSESKNEAEKKTLLAEIEAINGELSKLLARYEEEKLLVEKLLQEERPENYLSIKKELEVLQTESALIHPWVDEQVISEILSNWTGIPSDRMVVNEIDNILNLEKVLNDSIYGQETALKEIAQHIRIAKSGLHFDEGPLGVFMLTGLSGTGKTETANALANILHGSLNNLITFNMSEFQESHTVSLLKGAPPGYVGYGKGGRLTEAVKQKPYSIVLLDEFDKAHPDVHEVFYQVFDKGIMKDSEDRLISFKQTFIILTCNQGGDVIEDIFQKNKLPKMSEIRPLVYESLLKVFPAALLARITIIPYIELSENALISIAKKQLKALENHILDEFQASFIVAEEVFSWIVEKVATHPNRGRAVRGLLKQTILPLISDAILKQKREKGQIEKINLMVESSSLQIHIA